MSLKKTLPRVHGYNNTHRRRLLIRDETDTLLFERQVSGGVTEVLHDTYSAWIRFHDQLPCLLRTSCVALGDTQVYYNIPTKSNYFKPVKLFLTHCYVQT